MAKDNPIINFQLHRSAGPLGEELISSKSAHMVVERADGVEPTTICGRELKEDWVQLEDWNGLGAVYVINGDKLSVIGLCKDCKQTLENVIIEGLKQQGRFRETEKGDTE